MKNKKLKPKVRRSRINKMLFGNKANLDIDQEEERICAYPGCKAKLNAYNKSKYCYAHQRAMIRKCLD